MSACCVPDEAMVVSEIGEMLSPKVAPASSAPARKTASAPTLAPAGYSSGPQMRIVPKLVPVEVETSAQATNAAAT